VSLLGEIKRRKVFQVAAIYGVTAWLIIQIIDVVNEPLSLPEWLDTVVIVLLAVGFPVALILAWAFDLTPEGVVRDRGTTGAAPSKSGRGVEYVLIGLLVLVIAWAVYRVEFAPAPTEVETVVEESQREVLPNSVAVLPFENLSLDPENAFFAAGIHDELLNQLVKIKDLNVIARTSVLRYADKGEMTIPAIADELKVEAVMEGTVRYGGDSVRITAQLIDGDSNTHLWSQTYESEFDAENIFAIESDIAMQIAAALEAELLPAEQASIEKLPTASTEALTLYFRARASVADLGPLMPAEWSENLHRYLDAALLADPEFALAHALKAYEYALSTARTFRLSDDEAVARREALASEHARKALDLDPDLGIAYGALAVAHMFGLRRSEAQAAWERAYELSPGDPDILADFGYFAAATGQSDLAIRLARHAVDVAPNSAQTLSVAGFAFIFAGDYDEAARIERKAITLDPAFFFSYQMLGLVEAARGNHADALKQLRFAEELSRGIPSADVMSNLAYGYGLIGQREDAIRMFTQIESMATEYHVGAASWALTYLGIGDEKRALEFLESASDVTQGGEGYLALTYLVGNAFSDPVLEQRTFVEARRRLGLRDEL
jgi:TolB-like protein/Flp pilus assembly protein TadD